jgi:hypothetical protein
MSLSRRHASSASTQHGPTCAAAAAFSPSSHLVHARGAGRHRQKRHGALKDMVRRAKEHDRGKERGGEGCRDHYLRPKYWALLWRLRARMRLAGLDQHGERRRARG